MTTKVTALTMSVCAAVLCLASWTSPDTPLFYFISSNSAAVITRLVIATVLVSLAYKARFKIQGVKALTEIFAVLLICFGAAGLTVPSIDYSLYGLVDPLDYVFFIVGGLLIVSSALGLPAGRKALFSTSLPKLPEFKPLVRLVQTKWSL